MIWNEDRVVVLKQEVGAFLISIRYKMLDSLEEWVFSVVYGPVLSCEVGDFLEEWMM